MLHVEMYCFPKMAMAIVSYFARIVKSEMVTIVMSKYNICSAENEGSSHIPVHNQ